MSFFPPFTGSQVLLNLDLTLGASSLTGTGFSVNGTGETWNSKGFVGNGTAYLRNDNFTLRSSLYAAQAGFVMIEVERALLARDISQSTTNFCDSQGLADSALHYLLWADNGSTTGDFHQINKETNGSVKYLRNVASVGTPFVLHDYLNSRFSQGVDPVFCKVILTWSGTLQYLFVDGCCVAVITDVRAPAADDFKRIAFGSKFGASYIGAYAIRKIQIGTAFVNPLATISRKKIALIGDSFTQEACAVESPANPDSTTVSGINGKQTSLTVDSVRYDRMRRYRGVNNWGHIIQSRLLRETGVWHPIYNAGNSGNGWRSDRGAGTQITQAHVDAVVAQNPYLIVMPGSVNDITETVETFDVVTPLKAVIDQFISGCGALEQIRLVQPFGWYHSTNTAADSATWLTNYHEYCRQLQTLDGYKGKVVFVSHSWGARPEGQLMIGSNSLNSTASFGVDFHPSASGHVAIADLLYPVVKSTVWKDIPAANPATLLEDFDNLSEWTQGGTAASGIVETTDPVQVWQAAKSLRFTLDNTTLNRYIQKTVSWDFSTIRGFSILVYCHRKVAPNSIGLQVYLANNTSMTGNTCLYTISKEFAPGWNVFYIRMTDFTKYNAFTFNSAIQSVRFQIYGASNVLRDFTLDSMWVGSFGRPKVVMGFDDGFSDHYVAHQYASSKGIPMTHYLEPRKFGTEGYLTASQVDEMVLKGDAVAGHDGAQWDGSDGDSYSMMAEARAGMKSAGHVVNHGSFPQGRYGQYDEGGAGIDAIHLVNSKKHFLTCRGTGSGVNLPFKKVANWHGGLRGHPLNNTSTLQQAKDYLLDLIDMGGLGAYYGHLFGTADLTHWPLDDFKELCDFIASKRDLIDAVTIVEQYRYAAGEVETYSGTLKAPSKVFSVIQKTVS